MITALLMPTKTLKFLIMIIAKRESNQPHTKSSYKTTLISILRYCYYHLSTDQCAFDTKRIIDNAKNHFSFHITSYSRINCFWMYSKYCPNSPYQILNIYPDSQIIRKDPINVHLANRIKDQIT